MSRFIAWLRGLTIVFAALATFAVAGCGGGPTDTAKVPTTTTVDSADADSIPDKTLTVPETAAAEVAASEAAGHADARDESPAGVPSAGLEAAKEQQRAFAKADTLPRLPPLATQRQAGCTTSLVRNYSSRNGVAPRIIVVHYTVSSNRAGWGDVNANVSWFNSSAAQASSNYIIDREGHCAYIVPESLKAWAQATFNPVAISIEVINSGREGSLTSGAGTTKLKQVIRDAAKRWGIPLRLGATSGCTVTRTGVVDHYMLGACGGGHTDVHPYDVRRFIPSAANATPSGYASLKAGEKANVDELLAQRTIAKRHGGWKHVAAYHLARAAKAKNGLRASVTYYATHKRSAVQSARLAYLKPVIAG